MSNTAKSITILYADDDLEDQMLVKEAMEDCRLANPMHFVENGEELMDYLYRIGRYEHLKDSPLPGLILLDLNMPRKDGREALAEIKADRNLRRIPVIVLTTSKTEEDVFRTYDLGISGFIVKPITFESLSNMVKIVGKYWFEIVELPKG